MSLETVNRIFGEAIINASFCRDLLSDPGTAVRDYELGTDELALFSSVRAGSVDTLAQQILAGLGLERGSSARLSDPGGRVVGASSWCGSARSPAQAGRVAAPAATGAGKLVPLPAC
jgi:hypothetical protein